MLNTSSSAVAANRIGKGNANQRKSRPIDVVIPGRGLLPASPESITTGGNDTESIGIMDSGFAQERAPE
jgi:hypothetical protein